jgi:signal transduction histidine kinase/DNA-binding NarL/FixJ family response regulator
VDSPQACRVPQGDKGIAEPVLILTPTGRDAAVAVACLHAAGIQTQICHAVEEVCAAMAAAAAGLLADEALSAPALDVLRAALQRQPVWSDFPVILLTSSPRTTEALWQRVQELGAVGNVTVLERPLTRVTLLSTIQVALRSRRRQHEIRQLHAAQYQHVAAQAATLAQLHARDQALRHLNETLEQRVTDRTAALAQQTQQLEHEVTERHRMQEALFQQEKLAALGTLLANVAHELNNPLAVAALQLDNLYEAWGAGAWTDDLATLRQAVERCSSVVQSFLALARQQPPTRQAVALHAVIGDVLVLLQHALEVDGITVHLDLAEAVPLLWADPHQLQHVVTNLLTNAHHALREAAPPRSLRLTTAATADRTQVTLTIADTGAGIPTALQRHVFDPFFTTKPQGVGSGLGLPLCRTIVEGHGGTIQLVSTPGQGTTVYVMLPVVAPEQASEAATEPVAPVPAQSGAILLIDDEPGIAQGLRRLLQRSGHEVTLAANGHEGLAALAERAYAVILCDMRMPDLDGPGFYRELGRRHPHLRSRVIFLTGDVLSAEGQAFFVQSTRPRVVKPFKAQEIRQVIQQVLDATVHERVLGASGQQTTSRDGGSERGLNTPRA